MNENIAKVIADLTNADNMLKELSSIETKLLESELALYEQNRHGEAVFIGKDRLETIESRIRRYDKDPRQVVIVENLLSQEAHARAVVVLITSNNRKILGLLGLLSQEHQESHTSVWHRLHKRVFSSH